MDSILIRGTNWVGDAVMTTPALTAVRKNFPEARISLLVVPWVADVFRCNPSVDEIILYERQGRHRGLMGKHRLMREIRGRRFNKAILFQNAFEAALITWRAGIPQRMGYNTDLRGTLLTRSVHMRREFKRIHETEYYLNILRGLGLDAPSSPLVLRVPDIHRDAVQGELEGFGDGRGMLVAIAPGATYGSAKMWPADRYRETAHRLAGDFDARVVVLGSAKEQSIGNLIVEGLPSGRGRNLCGTTGLLEAAAWIERAGLFLSNDSGLMHVAAALGRPQVTVFGPTNRVTTGPLNPTARLVWADTECSPCLKKVCPTDHRCMERVSVDMVMHAATEVISSGRK